MRASAQAEALSNMCSKGATNAAAAAAVTALLNFMAAVVSRIGSCHACTLATIPADAAWLDAAAVWQGPREAPSRTGRVC
jgi:hypothetical protein